MNKKFKILSLLLLVAIIIIIISIVIFMNDGRYIRAQYLNPDIMDIIGTSYNITEKDLEEMPFIREAINANGTPISISHKECDVFNNFMGEHGTNIRYKNSCYELQLRMS